MHARPTAHNHQGSDPKPSADSHQGARAGAHAPAPAPHGDLPSPDAPAPPPGEGADSTGQSPFPIAPLSPRAHVSPPPHPNHPPTGSHSSASAASASHKRNAPLPKATLKHQERIALELHPPDDVVVVDLLRSVPSVEIVVIILVAIRQLPLRCAKPGHNQCTTDRSAISVEQARALLVARRRTERIHPQTRPSAAPARLSSSLAEPGSTPARFQWP